ncbi:helicase HerA domain-containing protein [Mycobacterium sp.]|uniref:ATP-binding protein n=1 Tax=Mycobacterium sp. TaxID=1785 RepID=UPI003F9DCAC4
MRYSTRLHAKLILADNAALVSSSNLTATAGYGLDDAAAWRNEELGVVIRSDDGVLSELESQFEAIWSSATRVEESTIGIAMDFPTVRQFSFVAIRDVRLGEYATAKDTAGNVILGRISEVTAYNPSFPQMNESMWITRGYSGTAGSSRVEVPDLQSLFSHPSKEHGFLVTKTFFEPESVFRIARVEVLKHYVAGAYFPRLCRWPRDPTSRTHLLTCCASSWAMGTSSSAPCCNTPTYPLPCVQPSSRNTLAVLGMTGSGKSNAINVLLHRISKQTGGQFPSLVVLDEAQNYAPEQQTKWLARGRPSFDAAFAIASEGRKFNVGLVVSSQRPARVNKDFLSQCNTHVVFRVANVEDLSALAGSFEAASQPR